MWVCSSRTRSQFSGGYKRLWSANNCSGTAKLRGRVPAVIVGATTNTPSLAAAQAALQALPTYSAASADYLGMAYAVAYPFGIVGIILDANTTNAAPEAKAKARTFDPGGGGETLPGQQRRESHAQSRARLLPSISHGSPRLASI
jgi:hypothetical protein